MMNSVLQQPTANEFGVLQISRVEVSSAEILALDNTHPILLCPQVPAGSMLVPLAVISVYHPDLTDYTLTAGKFAYLSFTPDTTGTYTAGWRTGAPVEFLTSHAAGTLVNICTEILVPGLGQAAGNGGVLWNPSILSGSGLWLVGGDGNAVYTLGDGTVTVTTIYIRIPVL